MNKNENWLDVANRNVVQHIKMLTKPSMTTPTLEETLREAFYKWFTARKGKKDIADWWGEILTNQLQKARAEVWNKVYQYADTEADGEVWLHGSQIIRRAKKDGVTINQSELDHLTSVTGEEEILAIFELKFGGVRYPFVEGEGAKQQDCIDWLRTELTRLTQHHQAKLAEMYREILDHAVIDPRGSSFDTIPYDVIETLALTRGIDINAKTDTK